MSPHPCHLHAARYIQMMLVQVLKQDPEAVNGKQEKCAAWESGTGLGSLPGA